MDDIEIEDKNYVVIEADYDLINGIKAVEGLDLRVVEVVVRVISNNTGRVRNIKVNEIPPKRGEIATSDVNNNNRSWEDMVNID